MEASNRVLACLSTAPSNARVLRSAARIAGDRPGDLTALFVQTPAFATASQADKARLQANMELAEALGARIETVSGSDIPFQIAEYARLAEIDCIVLGQSWQRNRLIPARTLTDRLGVSAPNAELHIIPDAEAPTRHRERDPEGYDPRRFALDLVISLGLLLLATALGFLFDDLGFTHSNIMMAYLLGVLLISAATSHIGFSLASAIASVFLFNYMFIAPRFSLQAYEPGYPVTFLVMFLTAFLTGSLAIRLRRNARQSAQAAYRTRLILETDQLLAKARSRQEILQVTAAQSGKLLDRFVAVFDDPDTEPAEIYAPTPGETPSDPGAQETVRQVWQTRERCGAGAWVYFPLTLRETCYGAAGVFTAENALDASEQSILLSILGECALALENEVNAREKEAAAVLAENERLRANLLRSISHDLRTPLTSISGHASNLMQVDMDPETRQRLYTDIYEDSIWLIDLVENLLSATRIENGQMQLSLSAQVVEELLQEAVQHMKPRQGGHQILLEPVEDVLLVRADGKLIVQVVANLIDNALRYTQADSVIRVAARRQGDQIAITVADNGPGIPAEQRERIFENFYSGAAPRNGGRRGLGLGLALCRSILTAHNGSITLEDVPEGACFTVTLPVQEVLTHE